MAKVIWGLDFGDWALKVARGTFDRKSDTLTVDLFDEIVYGELPCGYDASLLDKHREGVVAFRNKHQIGAGDALCVSVSGNEVFSRFINLPPVPESVGEIIRYEARQQIPFDIDDVVWDYQPVKEEHEVGEEIEVGLFALKKERVAELMDLLQPWRSNLRVLQDAPLAVYNLLEYEGLVSEAAIVVDIGAATTDVLVLNPPRFWVRTLLVAGDDLTNALVEQFGVGNSEAEAIKRQLGRSGHKEQILRVLQPVFDDLVNEIQRSLGYYKSLARDVKFERVLALGSALRMTGLTQMLAGGLQYQVKVIQELKRVKLGGGLDPDKFAAALPGLCAALGLLVQGAGRSRVRINMVPEELALASSIASKKPWLVGAAVGVAVAVAALILGERAYAQAAASAGQGVAWTALDEAKKVEQQYNTQAAAANQVESQLQTMAQSGIPADLFLELLPAYADTMPPSVYTVRLEFVWMERDEIGPNMLPLSSSAGGARRTGPTMGSPTSSAAAGQAMGAAMAAAAAERARSMASGGGVRPSAPSGMSRSGAPMPLLGRETTGPLRSAKSLLVMRFACESSLTSKESIQSEVFGALRKAQLPDELKPAYTDVRMLGDVHDVHRNKGTGETVAEPGEGVETYVAFEGYAIVNTGPEAAATQPARR